MPVVRRLLLAGAVTILAVGGGILVLDGDGGADADQDAKSTPLASFDTADVTILRTAFCDRVAEPALDEALGAPAEDAIAYGNGDKVRLAPGLRDLAHEYGCSWTAGGVTAAAWVYAPPVPRRQAGRLLGQARSSEQCEPIPDAPAYGDPSAGLVCTSGTAREVSFRGLFGDAWLVCSVRVRGVSAGESVDQAADRTGRWCVQVARAAAADQAAG
jgi:hypothetical protein